MEITQRNGRGSCSAIVVTINLTISNFRLAVPDLGVRDVDVAVIQERVVSLVTSSVSKSMSPERTISYHCPRY
jgi:hypothetical protein